MTHNPEFLKLVEAARAKIRECSVHDAQHRLNQGEQLYFINV